MSYSTSIVQNFPPTGNSVADTKVVTNVGQVGPPGPNSGASISIEDSGDYYSTDTVEEALQEVGADMAKLRSYLWLGI